MKKSIKQMRLFVPLLIALLATNSLLVATDETPSAESKSKPNDKPSSMIQVAILLDTSGSMKGLVDQARIQIWNVVNELSAASRNDGPSELQVAVYQFGAERLSKSSGYIKRVLDFSDDLDEVSRALFSLQVGGGVELCGEVIRQSTDDLQWNPQAGYRAIFIAGNEAFDQGKTSFGSTLPRLMQKNIKVNTIYCRWNKAKPGEDVLWKYAANIGSGAYSMINHNRKMTELKTPYDAEFRTLNKRMNESFVWYGKDAQKHMKNQIAQDANARKMSNSAFAARMSAKIGHLYKHVHSDLVDALQHGHLKAESMPESLMPSNLRKMSAKDRMVYLKSKIADREKVRRDMATVISKRNAWIAANSKTDEAKDTWGAALLTAVKGQLKESGFTLGSTD